MNESNVPKYGFRILDSLKYRYYSINYLPKAITPRLIEPRTILLKSQMEV